MIDCHCHLVDEKYSPDEIGHIIERAKISGVQKLISAGTGLQHTKDTLGLAGEYPEVFVAAGLGYEGGIDETLKTLVTNSKVVAIGECGLDEQSVQIELFAFHIKLAQETGLPLVVHCRNMFEQVYSMVKESNVTGMMHCFTGDSEWMKQFVDLGWYISFGGIVTFKKSDELRQTLRQTPQERILTETDCPYLSPEPFRKERNEPKRILQVVECVANTRSETINTVQRYTTQNAVRLFKL